MKKLLLILLLTGPLKAQIPTGGVGQVTGTSPIVVTPITGNVVVSCPTCGAGGGAAFTPTGLQYATSTTAASVVTPTQMFAAFSTQSANCFFAGPASGSAANATCRAMVNADLPTTMTGITIDGVTPTTMGYLDATSSIQTQLNAKAPLASPALTGTPTAPTAAPGTNTTQLATMAALQAAIAGVTAGAAPVVYSGPSLTLSGTQYFPIGGGGLASTTETNVDLDSPAPATIQNFSVQMSAAPGIGNSVVFTWRKNASGTALTCTISGASATSCTDLTHTMTVVQSDLLDIQSVTTGTIVGTPTLVMGTQFGIAASGGTSSGWTNVTNLLTPTGCTVGSAPYVCTVGSAVASITIAAIPQTGLNLRIIVNGQDSSAVASTVGVFNGDTSAHYAVVPVQATSAGINIPSLGSQVGMPNLCALGAPGLPGGCEIEVDAYSLTLPKLAISQWGVFSSISATTSNFWTGGVYAWNQTSAITSVKLTDAGTTFAAGDVVMVYISN